jgi:hypothetical protein
MRKYIVSTHYNKNIEKTYSNTVFEEDAIFKMCDIYLANC